MRQTGKSHLHKPPYSIKHHIIKLILYIIESLLKNTIMKKALTVLLAVVTTTSIFAQHNSYEKSRNESRDVPYDNTDNRSVYNSNKHLDKYKEERNRQIDRINDEFNREIESVRKDRSLRHSEKKRRISFLESQRNQRIDEAMARFSPDRNAPYNDRYANNSRKF